MWGTASVPVLCRRARKLGYRRIALTDTDNLYGLWPFLRACRREGLVPIVGAEVTDPKQRHRAVCLVQTDAGYRNLCRLLSRRHMKEGFTLEAEVPPLSRGLLVLTGNADLLRCWHAAGVWVAAAMPRHPLPPGHRLRRTAATRSIPMAAVPGSFFLGPEDIPMHRMLRAIDRNTGLSRLTPADTAPADAWLDSPGGYARRFAACPEALRATDALAETLSFTGPDFGIVLPPWNAADAAGTLREEAYAGARSRYGSELSEAVVDRLETELRTISRMGFSAYFLVVRDIVRQSPRICGRGSGAASLIAYCLGITNVCPIKHNLYFGRFLNLGRKDPPDIDVDFAWDERDDVLAAVFDTYRDHAAMVANHVLFQPRMAIREVAKVYGLTDGEIGRVTRRLPMFWRVAAADADLHREIAARPEARALGFPDPWPDILGNAQRILGTPRYLSVHSGGVVITPGPIDTYVPIQQAPKGVPIIQWEKDTTEEASLVKIDLLGNRSLGVIRDALANLKENGNAFDEFRWEPEDDFATQESVAQGRTMGCFYIESPAMRLLQKKAGVGDFEHLVIHSSIIRPATNDCIQEYLRRLHGGHWEPIHPLLTDTLDETFGIMVYQEDVSKAAVSLAGFSDAEADGLRKILSKKGREHALRDLRDRFFRGAAARGVSQDQTDAVWDMIMSFSGYSFCKPHSASYALVSFQAAYLKVHYPAEFMAAVISNGGGFYSTFAYVSEARRMGLDVLPPDVALSDERWSGNNGTIRVGLIAIKGLSEEIRTRILAERSRPFSGMDDFLDRIRPDEAEARALIHCGALDRFNPGGNRAELLWHLALWHRSRHRTARSGMLFGGTSDTPPPALPPEDPRARLRREFSVSVFCATAIPWPCMPRRSKHSGQSPPAICPGASDSASAQPDG